STSALVSDLSRAAAYGASLGVLSSVMDVGHSTGPIVTGLLVAAWGYGPAFALVAALLVICAAIFATLVDRARNQVFQKKPGFSEGGCDEVGNS
ncbi:MAG: hypothetical protein KAX24_14170, partial [Anaerolineae bacterium]|nr:hypothetical protein [Anaerolineae bacterium]